MSDPVLPDESLTRRGFELMARFVRAEPRRFAISVAGSTIFALASVAFTIVLGRVTDDLITPAFEGGERASFKILGVLVVVAVLRSLGIVTRRFFAGLTVYNLWNRYQRSLADLYLDLPYADLRGRQRGALLAHADSDVDAATDALSPLPFAIGVIVMLVAGLASMVAVDIWLTVVVLALFPSLWAMNRVYVQVAARPALAVRHGVAAVSDVATESFDGATVIKTLGIEEWEHDRFAAASLKLREAQVRMARIRAGFAAATAALPEVAGVALVWLGAWHVGQGAISVGDLVQALALFGVLSFPIHVIGFFMGGLPPAVVADDRINSVLAGEHERPTGNRRLPDGPLSLTVDDLDIGHGNGQVLHGLSLSVAPGEVVALVGATGSGKSTLVEVIGGLVPADNGTVHIGGIPIDELSHEARSERVALAFQEPYLLADRVDDNVVFGGDATTDEVRRAASMAQVLETIDRLPAGFRTELGERGVTLSGGQRQRVALARAIARRPGLLLLDDATSAIDPALETEILHGLRELATTMLVVAHRRSTVALADRVLFLADGHVVAQGTHAELMETLPAYRALLQAYDAEDRP